MLRLWLATGLLLTLAPLAAFAAERDILDSTSERPLGATINGNAVRFADPELDNAEITLRDYLPRPWTTTRVHALFQAAYTRFGVLYVSQATAEQVEAFDHWWRTGNADSSNGYGTGKETTFSAPKIRPAAASALALKA